MRKYKLTSEEKDIVNELNHYSIPFIFKSGKYCADMQYFEFVGEICESLLKVRTISDKEYEIFMYEDIDYIPQIEREKLDKYTRRFYDLYLLVKELVKKYYNGVI